MATSSIGQVVKLDDKLVERFAEICAKPTKWAKGPNGPTPELQDKSLLDKIR